MHDQYKGNFLTGRPAQGSYIAIFTVSDSCRSASNKVTGKFRFDVKDPTPPTLSGLSISPTSLSAAGGEVVFKVTASDNKAVKEVNAAVSRPGWGQRVYVTRVSGNETSGVWQGSYKAPANTSSRDVSYTVEFIAADDDGNKETLSGVFVVKGNPAGSTVLKGRSIQ